MSDAAAPIAPEAPAFSPRTVLAMVLIGVLAATGFGLLSTFAPDLRSGADGGAHALSKSAVGYAGLAHLLRDRGVPVVISRGAAGRSRDGRGLLILTPGPGVKPGDIQRLAASRQTLLVLPKWMTTPDRRRPAWVESAGLIPPQLLKTMVPPGSAWSILRDPAPRKPTLDAVFGPFPLHARLPLGPVQSLQWASGGFQPLLLDHGRAVLLTPGKGVAYVLTDPDILNNHGLASLDTARTAVAVVDGLREGGPVVFDVTLNGFKRSRSLWRLALEPPFLAATLCVLAAAALMGAHAAVRFGPVLRPERSIALGAAALADNAAALIALAGREPRMAARYAALTRRAIARAVGVKPDLTPDAADAALDRLRGDKGAFSEQVVAAERATDAATLMTAARRLHETRMEMTRERR